MTFVAHFNCCGDSVVVHFHIILILVSVISKMQATIIDPADIEALECALDENNVSIEGSGLLVILVFFFVSSP